MKINEIERLAIKRAEGKIAFYTHLAIYIFVNIFLFIVWYFVSRGFPWFIFSLFGWGIGLLTHFIHTFSSTFVDRIVKKEYEKLKK
ncbi:MAG: 2TM domain-containing protein [Thermoplasmatales archaeon]|nr:2TM domain-containing protein [Thermoplasmatales archaeon]